MDYFLPTVACHNPKSGLDDLFRPLVESTVISEIDRMAVQEESPTTIPQSSFLPRNTTLNRIIIALGFYEGKYLATNKGINQDDLLMLPKPFTPRHSRN